MARALALAALVAAAAATGEVTVDTIYGPVIGEADDAAGVVRFRSVPFAAPPVGPLRFSNPVPPTPWTAPRDARGEHSMCPQLKLDGELLLGSEDCLYLRVTVPEGVPADAKLPVMFWIFGGAWVLGDSEELGWYDATRLARENRVIVVSPEYRVGPFGFLAQPALQAEPANGGSTGNAGLLDQVAALRWTKGSIAAFGGDPERITIFGESAGGFSVCWHLVSPMSKGLFTRAIMQSATCDAPQFFQPLQYATDFNVAYGSALGCPNATADGQAQLDCLRSLSTQRIMESLADFLNPNWPFVNPSRNSTRYFMEEAGLPGWAAAPGMPALAPIMPWGSAIDGVALTELPLASLQRGAINGAGGEGGLSVLLGTNKDEGSIFIPIFPLIVPNTTFPPREADMPRFIEHAYDQWNASLLANLTNSVILPVYPASAYPRNDTWQRGTDILTHAFFSCASRRTARALTAAGVPTYLYQWSYKMDLLLNDLVPQLGNYHTSELYFTWGNEGWPAGLQPWSATDRAMSEAFQAWWTSFAASGDPSVGHVKPVPYPWPRYSLSAGGEVNMQIEDPLSITTDLLDYECTTAWDELFYAASGVPRPAYA